MCCLQLIANDGWQKRDPWKSDLDSFVKYATEETWNMIKGFHPGYRLRYIVKIDRPGLCARIYLLRAHESRCIYTLVQSRVGACTSKLKAKACAHVSAFSGALMYGYVYVLYVVVHSHESCRSINASKTFLTCKRFLQDGSGSTACDFKTGLSYLES